MSKFDTHGGYFSPKDYIKVEEGGSHEENPNGGVQVGVDPQGTPNLLEEGEPVYKDYVYSDNIEADGKFLEENKIPVKYAGKLYSKIADDFVSEAEERPMDPISRNGLEAMLGRLADAQESQKQAEEQRKLEEELASLSPEELDQLEAMLAQGQPVGEDNPVYGEGPVGLQGEPGIPPEPMMARGGRMRRNMFDGGGPYYPGQSGFLYSAPEYPLSSMDPRALALERIAAEAMAQQAAAEQGAGVPVPSSGRVPVYSSTIPFDRSINGEEFEAEDYYKDFLAHMLAIRDSEEANQWMQYIQDEIAKSGSKYKLNGFENWYDLATDKKVGPVHQATKAVAQELARRRQMRANRVMLDSAPGMSAPQTVDPNAVGLGPYGEMFGTVNPSQALAARELAKKVAPQVATRGILDTVLPGSGAGMAYSTLMSSYPGTEPQDKGPESPAGNGEGAGAGGYDPYEEYSPKLLPTFPRYAGAIGSGLLGLYNAFQQPDRYTASRIPVHTPEGRVNFQNQVYRPIDQNMIANAQIAQGNATTRALRDSGLGPAAAASILAADNNLTGNLGAGFIQAWDANNQRRNAVTAANNQVEAQRATLDANMDYYRTLALNNAAVRNAQNDLMIQRLNNEAEGQKYAAISNQINNGLQALSNIGKENFSMNQINTNPYFIGYGTGPNGVVYYNPLTRKMEKVDKTKK